MKLLYGGPDIHRHKDWLSHSTCIHASTGHEFEANHNLDDVDTATEELIELSFLKRNIYHGLERDNISRDSISLHPLIHRWASERLNMDEQRQTACFAIHLVTSTYNPDLSNWDYAIANRVRSHFELSFEHVCIKIL